MAEPGAGQGAAVTVRRSRSLAIHPTTLRQILESLEWAIRVCREREEKAYHAKPGSIDDGLSAAAESYREALETIREKVTEGRLDLALAEATGRLTNLVALMDRTEAGFVQADARRRSQSVRGAKASSKALDLLRAMDHERRTNPKRCKSDEGAVEAVFANARAKSGGRTYRRRWLPSFEGRLPDVESALRQVRRERKRLEANAEAGRKLLARMKRLSPEERAELSRRTKEVRSRLERKPKPARK